MRCIGYVGRAVGAAGRRWGRASRLCPAHSPPAPRHPPLTEPHAPPPPPPPRPRRTWVRSLVPNEKNSACLARSPARSAPRGTSIMVPTLYSTRAPAALNTASAAARITLICFLWCGVVWCGAGRGWWWRRGECEEARGRGCGGMPSSPPPPPAPLPTPHTTPPRLRTWCASSSSKPTRGTMIWGCALMPFLDTLTAASRMALACISVMSVGVGQG